MKNIKLKLKIAINALFASVVAFDTIEFAVKYVALSMGKIASIDMQFGWGDFAWIIGLSVLLIGYVIEDLADDFRELKSKNEYGIPKFNVKTEMPEVKPPKYDGTNGNGYQPVNITGELNPPPKTK